MATPRTPDLPGLSQQDTSPTSQPTWIRHFWTADFTGSEPTFYDISLLFVCSPQTQGTGVHDTTRPGILSHWDAAGNLKPWPFFSAPDGSSLCCPDPRSGLSSCIHEFAWPGASMPESVARFCSLFEIQPRTFPPARNEPKPRPDSEVSEHSAKLYIPH